MEDQARADEIVAAWDLWREQQKQVERDIGLTAAKANSNALDEKTDRLNAAIRDTLALSLKRIGIKASWALGPRVNDEDDLKSVLQQVEAFAYRYAFSVRCTAGT